MLNILETLPKQPPKYLQTSCPVQCGAGFFGCENDGEFDFRWMSAAGRLEFAPADEPRYLEMLVLSEFRDGSQRLTCAAGAQSTEVELLHGWDRISVPVAAGATSMQLSVNKPFPREYYPGDDRELFVRVANPAVHADERRHVLIVRQHENRLLNQQEMHAGATVLESIPQKVGVDMHAHCNIKPPCVYCDWDQLKREEGKDVSARFDVNTLHEWGDFFDRPFMFQNCSIGEPFLHKNINSLFDYFGDYGKLLEFSSNGQILSDENIQAMLGRNLHMYVSLDAATAETYARLRNNEFAVILQNLRRLIAAKGGRGPLPLVYLVFMPMRANMHEATAFVDLCHELQVDRLILRPLNREANITLTWQRAGYMFDYRKDLLPLDELRKVSEQMHARGRELGVAISDQMQFGQEDVPQRDEESAAGPDLPGLGEHPPLLCNEPWKSLYILRRGVMPCSYGRKPLGHASEYREIWNGPALLEMREKLAAGEFPQYCLETENCPIVQQADLPQQLTILPFPAPHVADTAPQEESRRAA